MGVLRSAARRRAESRFWGVFIIAVHGRTPCLCGLCWVWGPGIVVGIVELSEVVRCVTVSACFTSTLTGESEHAGQVAESFMELFRVNSLSLVNQTEGGFKVLSPVDSWSVRLSLLGLSEGFERQLERALGEYSGYDPMAPALLKRLLQYAKQAWKATTGGEDHKYVLLNEGPFKWEGHSYLVQCLRRYGLGVPGQDITVWCPRRCSARPNTADASSRRCPRPTTGRTRI